MLDIERLVGRKLETGEEVLYALTDGIQLRGFAPEATRHEGPASGSAASQPNLSPLHVICTCGSIPFWHRRPTLQSGPGCDPEGAGCSTSRTTTCCRCGSASPGGRVGNGR